MFFGLDNGNGNEASRQEEPHSGRGSALDNPKTRSSLSLSKRLSMTSLISLTSIDVMTPSNEGNKLEDKESFIDTFVLTTLILL